MPLAFSKGILIWGVFVGLAISVLVKGLNYNPYKKFEFEEQKKAEVNKAYSLDREDVAKAVIATRVAEALRDERKEREREEERRVINRLERDADSVRESLRPVAVNEPIRRENEGPLRRMGSDRPRSRLGSERPVLMSDIMSDKPVMEVVKEAVKEALEEQQVTQQPQPVQQQVTQHPVLQQPVQQVQHPVAAVKAVEAVVEKVVEKRDESPDLSEIYRVNIFVAS